MYLFYYLVSKMETNTFLIHNLQDFYSIVYHDSSHDSCNIYFIPTILEFWESNKDFWFSHKLIQDDEFQFIQTTYNSSDQTILLSLILHYDQLYRHPCSAIKECDKYYAFSFATHIAFKIIHNVQLWYEMSSWKKIFTLLVLRHNHSLPLKTFVLKKIYYEIDSMSGGDTQEWLRFLNATIWDIHTFKQKNGYQPIQCHVKPLEYYMNHFQSILESKKYIEVDYVNHNTLNLLIENVERIVSMEEYQSIDVFGVSISGGVDSMVLSYITNQVLKKYNKKMILIHIGYNNRHCIDKEYSLLKYWAQSLNVELYIREIDEIKRSRSASIRTTYENITRRIRFSIYQYFQEKYKRCPILLGHNLDDTYENIFSNLSKQIHFENLAGMKEVGLESNVTIIRPFLTVPKSSIVSFADYNNIPHLYDSTPGWSQRGKTRDTLIPAINTFDSRILSGLHEFVKYTNFLEQQWNNSFKCWINHALTITNNDIFINKDSFFINNYINISFWVKIWFTLQLPTRPSNKSIRNAIQSINTFDSKKSKTCDLNKIYNLILTKQSITIHKKII